LENPYVVKGGGPEKKNLRNEKNRKEIGGEIGLNTHSRKQSGKNNISPNRASEMEDKKEGGLRTRNRKPFDLQSFTH